MRFGVDAPTGKFPDFALFTSSAAGIVRTPLGRTDGAWNRRAVLQFHHASILAELTKLLVEWYTFFQTCSRHRENFSGISMIDLAQ